MRSLPWPVTCGNTRVEMKAWYGEDASQTVWMGFYLWDPLVTQQSQVCEQDTAQQWL